MLIGEILRARHRGKGSGMVHSGWAVGWGAAAIVLAVCFSVFPVDIAWRAMFAAGLLPAGFVFFLRRAVDETPIFLANQRLAARPAGGFMGIFRADLLRTTIVASMLATGAQGGYYAVMTWLPTYLQLVRHLSVLNTGGYLSVVIVASFIGYVSGAYLTDGLGRRAALILFSVASVFTVVSYTFLSLGDASMLVLGAPLGFFASGSSPPAPTAASVLC